MTQRHLTDFNGGPPTTDGGETSPASMGAAPTSLRDPKTMLSKQATTDEPSCPWCLHPESGFVENSMGQLCCPCCHSPVPVKAEWYQRGEKVCL